MNNPASTSPSVLLLIAACTSIIPAACAFGLMYELYEGLALANPIDLTYLFWGVSSLAQAFNVAFLARLILGSLPGHKLALFVFSCSLLSLPAPVISMYLLFGIFIGVDIPGQLHFALALMIYPMVVWLATVSSMKLLLFRRLPGSFIPLILLSAFLTSAIVTCCICSIESLQSATAGFISCYLCITIPSLATTAYLTRYREIINPETIEIQT